MQNHGFFAAINEVVSLAQLYCIPLCRLVAFRGHWDERYPRHTRGGIVTEEVLRALGIPLELSGGRCAKSLMASCVDLERLHIFRPHSRFTRG